MTGATPILSGCVADLNLEEVMKVLSLGRQLMRLEVASPAGQPIGNVVLKAGRIVSATAGHLEGQEALRTVLAAEGNAQFRILRENRSVTVKSPLGLVGDLAGGVIHVGAPSAVMAEGPRVRIMEGRLDEFDFVTLLQTLSIGRQYTEICVLRDDGTPIGSVVLKAGVVVTARMDAVTGPGAFAALIAAAPGGRFEVSRPEGAQLSALARTPPIGLLAQILVGALKSTAEMNEPPPPAAGKAPGAAAAQVTVMQGLLSEFDIPTLLQTLGVGRQTLSLELSDKGAPVGTLVTKAGMLVTARAGELQGWPAVRKLMQTPPDRQFNVFRLVGDLPPGEPIGTIAQVLMTILDPMIPEAAQAVVPTRDWLAVMQGRVADVGIRALLEVLAASRLMTQIQITRGGTQLGLINLKAGRVVSAQTSVSDGIEAFRMLLDPEPDCTFGVYRSPGAVVAAESLGTIEDLLEIEAATRPVSLPPAVLAKLGSRKRLPAPLWLGLAGAAGVVAFVALRSPTIPPPETSLPTTTAVVEGPPRAAPGTPSVSPPPAAPTAVVAPPAPPVVAVAPVARGSKPGVSPTKLTVRRAQILLRRRGFSPGQIDNMFGPRTGAAVSAFQRAEGLPDSGKLDIETVRALARPANP